VRNSIRYAVADPEMKALNHLQAQVSSLEYRAELQQNKKENKPFEYMYNLK
jgi:hypothetical protein